MAAKTGTYTLIASSTLGSSGTVTFSSIPQTYTDLIVVAAGTSTGNGQISLRFNGVTNSYSTTTLTGDGSSAGSTRETAATYMQLGYWNYFTSGTYSSGYAHIFDYANTTTFKTVLSRMGNTGTGIGASVGLWRSTAAITSVEVLPASYNFASGTTVKLYGIEAGNN